jgi:hypothetical protein
MSKLKQIDFILFTTIAVIYVITCAPSITGEDSASFHLALSNFGINHPPGYPLYTILGSLFVKTFSFILPTPFLTNFFSSLWAILSLFVLNNIIKSFKVSSLARVISVLTAAFSVGFWSQSNVAEVYTMNVFLTLLAISIFLPLANDIREDKSLKEIDKKGFLFSFITGLGLSHHYPLLLVSLAPLIVYNLIVLPKPKLREYLIRSRFLLNIAFLALGLLPYVYIFIRALYTNPDYVFGNLYNIGDVFHHISRENYSVLEFQKSTLEDKLNFYINNLSLFWENLRLLLPFAVIGIAISIRSKSHQLIGLLFSILGSTFLLSSILSFPYTPLFKAVMRVYPLPATLISTIFIALALEMLYEKAGKSKRPFLSILIICATCFQFFTNYRLSSRNGDYSNVNGSIAYLESLPLNSRLILSVN